MIEDFAAKLELWSHKQSAVSAAAIVGSWARGTARADSDIDVILITSQPEKLLHDLAWLSEFGHPEGISKEDWGLVQSLRVIYTDQREIEFGITTDRWVCADEIPSGTGRVIGDGVKVVYDPKGLLANLIVAVKDWQTKSSPDLS